MARKPRISKETKARLREAVLSALMAESSKSRAECAGNHYQEWRVEECSYDTGTAATFLLKYDIQRELGVTDAQITRCLDALVKENLAEEVGWGGRRRRFRWISPDLRAYRDRAQEERNKRNARADAVCAGLRASGIPAVGPSDETPDDATSKYVEVKHDGSFVVPLHLMERVMGL